MAPKRKIEIFDPNKSDSDDVDFNPSEAAPRRSAKKSQSQKIRSGGSRKRTKYGGSDIEDDLDESLDDLDATEPSEEDEDIEMNEKTGRAVRKAAKKSVNYEEPSDESEMDIEQSDSDDHKSKKKTPNKRSRPDLDDDEDDEDEDEVVVRKKSRIVKLKITTPQIIRATRAGSAARTLRRGSTVEPRSAGLSTRRTRATSEAVGEEPIALSESGRHVIRAGHSPEPLPGRRATRGAKGVKQPASTIKEELYESSLHEQDEDVVVATQIAGTDEQEDQDEADEDPQITTGLTDEVEQPAEPEEGAAQREVGIDDDDVVIPVGRTRGSRAGLVISDPPAEDEADSDADAGTAKPAGGPRRLTRGSKNKQQKRPTDASSDFEPGEESAEDHLSASDAEKKKKDDEYESSPRPRGRRATQVKSKSTSRRRASASEADDLDEDELAEELRDLKAGSRRRKPRASSQIVYERSGRARKPVDYSIKPMDQIYAMDEDGEDAAPTPTRRAKGRSGASQAWERNLYTTFGPFGGGGGPAPIIGGPWGTGATGGVDSDSSDDENMTRPTGIGGNVGMTPTSAMPSGLLPGLTNHTDPAAAISGTPANFGKIKSQKALADADPLGVDQNVDFSKIGGLDGYIDKLKEMVQMPLLYPEIFQKFHVTPPRGVLFYGPPGTGKTLVARALAGEIGAGGRKITFYMRKGADALSKWVGEAERQLRLLFEEARKTQPSIIFFDEIDGLAPVRSSKQEQIHASIVSTLLALMDGMDGRGQVIVIGATNRPDNIDPALRRPGRFDREFNFQLPDETARKSILNINTEGWGIDDTFKSVIAAKTHGYGGADLRALCTEAAINSIKRTYPQIYSSKEKLIIDNDKVKISAPDFMLSINELIPSSERSTSSGPRPLPTRIEPLLRDSLKTIEKILDGVMPRKKKTTALEEAMYEQYDDADFGFARETMQQEFERSRVFRPRLLIGGEAGMGQTYIGGAILNHLEGLHVQNFDLPTLFSDPASSPEATIGRMFAEVKRNKPSVIYIPGVDIWYNTLSEAQITTFLGLLRQIPPTDPVLLLGTIDCPVELASPEMLRDLFGYSKKSRVNINRPTDANRDEFFDAIIQYVQKTPKDFPDPANRKKRKLEVLQIAPPPVPKPPTKEEIKALKKGDHQLLNLLKVAIQPIMDQIQKKYRKFRQPVIPQSQIQYIFDERDPNFVRPDIPQFRPYELDTNKDGVKGLRETASGKFYYNLETTTIEERLANGFYARPKDFLADIKSLAKDAKHIGDKDRELKAKELVTNVEVDLAGIEANPAFAECENVYQRQLQRMKANEAKQRKEATPEAVFDDIVRSDIPENAQPQAGSITLGDPSRRPIHATPGHSSSRLSNGHSSDHTTNGSVPSQFDDTCMSGTGEHSQQISQGMQPPSQFHSMTNAFSNPGPISQISQRSAFQEIPHDASPSALINDASTTTSGKKTSEGWSTQATNGVNYGHPPSSFGRPGPDSQLPDTQHQSQQDASILSSDDQWPHSQAHGLARGSLQGFNSHTPSSGSQYSQNPAVPPFFAPPRHSISKPAGMANLLNDSPLDQIGSSQLSSQNVLISDNYFPKNLRYILVTGSSGLTVEQLEQINRELMDNLWRKRGEWNRNVVAGLLEDVFNETLADIEETQKVLPASQLTGIHHM